ncbi:MAG: alpha-isopropylmalate synthase regulatory domain-containing protein [Synergistaceae bacterium]|nr:alpha-isopropylmalate synthase regulatory domain-containing protein [Synergistaceae bacterium]
MKEIKFTDITLREVARGGDGALSFKEIIEMAKILDKLKLDVISLAPIVNEKIDSLLVRTVASAVRKSALSIPVGFSEAGVDVAWNAVAEAAHPRLYVEAPLSAVQMEFVCHKKPEGVIEMTDRLVRRARALCPDVEFAAVDATRSEPEFLYKAIRTALAAGATTVTVCDSAGTMMPYEFNSFIKDIYANVPELREAALGVKCSDELAMAAACAVSAVKAGASEVDVAVSGRCAPELETAAHIIRTRGDDCGYYSGIKYTELHRSIAQMNWITRTQRSKTSAFDTGLSISGGSDVLLDANDDIEALSTAVSRLGYDLSEEDMTKVYDTFINVAKKKSVGTKELEAIIATSALQVPPTYELVSFVINSGNIINATANIHCRRRGEDLSGLAVGDGPIDAAFLAIEQITGHHYELDDFQIQAVTEGREAMGSTLVKLRSNGRLYSGNGISTDIIGSSIRAYFNALNKIAYEENHR